MKIVYEMPKEGQFVAAWWHKGRMCCESMKVEDGLVYVDCNRGCGWELLCATSNYKEFFRPNTRFIV